MSGSGSPRLPGTLTGPPEAATPGTPCDPPATPRNSRDALSIKQILQDHGGPFSSLRDMPGLGPAHAGASGVSISTIRCVDVRVSPRDLHVWYSLQAWLLSCRSDTTRRGYLRGVAAFLNWLGETTVGSDLFGLTAHDLAAYRDHLVRNGVAHHLAAIRSFYQFSVRHGLIEANPAVGLTVPRPVPRTKPAPLTPAERQQLQLGCARLASKWPRHTAAIALLNEVDITIDVVAGLDTGQILDVLAPDGGQSTVIVIPRDDGHDEVISLSSSTRAVLQPLLAIRRLADPLIRQGDGSRISYDWVHAALTDVARAGGLPRERVRQLRPSMLRPAAAPRKPDRPRPRAAPISKSLWKQVAHLLPQRRETGGRRVDDRVVLAGILYLMAGDTPWHKVPRSAIGCSSETCQKRIQDWTDAGVWPRIHHLLRDELRMTGRLPAGYPAVDAPLSQKARR
ncbi:transposase [Nonomuraea turcica]|uniref:transposase n=1 Tax=Nonomuraea sp. G32 TaxID=3067274 RepID=UPI00273CD0F6|nr:transposase [Nonomuraea sp. G32]MDP4512110.1 transposase [Nonomuraea sp. G32]